MASCYEARDGEGKRRKRDVTVRYRKRTGCSLPSSLENETVLTEGAVHFVHGSVPGLLLPPNRTRSGVYGQSPPGATVSFSTEKSIRCSNPQEVLE